MPTYDPLLSDYAVNTVCAPELHSCTFYLEEKLTFGSPHSLLIMLNNNNYYYVLGVECNCMFKEE